MPQHQTLLLRIAIYRAVAARRCFHNVGHSIEKDKTVLQIQLLLENKGDCAVTPVTT